MKITKVQLNKILVEERAKQRAKSRQSLFMTRTRGIYVGQKNRIEKLMPGETLPYTLEDLRTLCETSLNSFCAYCGKKLTVKTMCADHALPVARGGQFTLSNLVICHQQCNFRKGILTHEEFKRLTKFVDLDLPDVARADFWRRLVVGGRWSK